MSSPEQITKTAVHVTAWFRAEEDKYAAIAPGKFGYARNLNYLREGRVRHASVWEGQLTNYWSRATRAHASAVEYRKDPIAARQLFAKHVNASRALLTTLVARTTDYSYETAKALEEQGLLEEAKRLATLPFNDPQMFSPTEYWGDVLEPRFEVVRDVLNDTAREEDRVFAAATEPLRELMNGSFHALLGYVALEGPLPLPGQPSGYLYPWTEASEL